MAGAYDVVVAGGIESMSRVPMGVNRLDQDPQGPTVRERFPDLVPQGVSAELVAHKWGLSRARSSTSTPCVPTSGRRPPPRRAGSTTRSSRSRRPTGPRSASTSRSVPAARVEKLGELRAVFGTPENQALLPHIDWKVTAGNASQITDGAGAMLVMSAERAAALGLRPRARIVASAVVGDDPVLMLTGPIPATTKVLERAGLTIDQIDAVEINEAFASVPLAWAAEFPIDPEKLNPRGGAVALGHPLGASGIRLMTTMINHLEQTGGRYGLQSMCEAGGMANATIIEILR